MIELTLDNLERYLAQALGKGTRLVGVGTLGALDEQGMKEFGYGKPLLLTFERKGRTSQAVLSVMRGDRYGHQDYWDRARVLLFQYEAGSRMERHARPLAVGYVDRAGALRPLKDPAEFFLLTEKVEGRDYFRDLERIRGKEGREGEFRPEDLTQVRAFARWLAGVHAEKKADPDLYLRRVRNLVGDCECIFGIIDGYPLPYAEYPPERFMALEKRLVDWRWKLKGYAHRLAAVHGDFHPWNVLVRDDGEFSVLDRSRGEWGEPADDLACMGINLLLFGLYEKPLLGGHFLAMFLAFWQEYLDRTGDQELLEVAAPFFVFRALVIASPQWYPRHPPAVRQGLFRLMENVLEDRHFNFADINSYME